MQVGILEAGRPTPDLEHHGSYASCFEKLFLAEEPGWQFTAYPVSVGVFPEDLDKEDAFVITGSRSGVYDDEPWIAPLKILAQKLHAKGKPLVGICFGHQLIAEALGGKVEKSPKGWGIGVHGYHVLESRDWMDPSAPNFTIPVVHQDQVISVAEEAMVLGGNNFCPNGIIQYGDKTLTFQGHPEIDHDFLRELLETRSGRTFDAELARLALATTRKGNDRHTVGRWICNFIKQAV